MKREPIILWEGECCYALREEKDGAVSYDIRVFSSNCVRHVSAGVVNDGARAEAVCKRLNAYPKQTRHFHGLL